jgi:pimeloyl-ACP methyl ester carboxylesterase
MEWCQNSDLMACTRAWFGGAKRRVWVAVLGLSLTACVAEHGKVREDGHRSNPDQRGFVPGQRSLTPSEAKSAAYLSEAKRAYTLLIAGRPSGPSDVDLQPVIQIYDRAVADFIASLPRVATANSLAFYNAATSESFRVTFDSPASDESSPEYFEKLQLASRTKRRGFNDSVVVPGVGVPLVGVPRRVPAGAPPIRYESVRGFRVPVTAVLEFESSNLPTSSIACVHLINPRALDHVRLGGKRFVLAADFTAPMASYERVDSLWTKFVHMVRGEGMRGKDGLIFLEPYDPQRIPVVFVHGLLSSATAWQNVANSLIRDPEIRRAYEFWVFEYPTGKPIAVSALRLREDLAAAQTQYQITEGTVLIGHSMGGLLCRMQVTDSRRALWDPILENQAEAAYRKIPDVSLMRRSLIFRTNPSIKRVIFIATPHRGSPLAGGGIAAFTVRLIRFSSDLLAAIEKSGLHALGIDEPTRKTVFPTSIEGLSPKSPLLIALNGLPIQAPHHSIIGDRGRGNTPNSSDGVVPYWSSQLTSAESELIVPDGHGAMDDPQAIAEIARILRKHAALTPGRGAPKRIRVPLHRPSAGSAQQSSRLDLLQLSGNHAPIQ